MYKSTEILNIYNDVDSYNTDKDTFESFLFKIWGNLYLDLKNKLRVEVYIQLISVIHPLFKSGEYLKVKTLFLNAYKNINTILYIQDIISPALIFFPYVGDRIMDIEFLEIFYFHKANISYTSKDVMLSSNLSLHIAIEEYPLDSLRSFNMKVDWCDDTIWSYVIAMRYKKYKWEIISRLAFFVWKDKILISCLQNKQVGRDYYKVKNILWTENMIYYLFDYFLENYGFWKDIIFFKNESHNCRIYDMINTWFIGNYDVIAKKYGCESYKSIFWKYESNSLI